MQLKIYVPRTIDIPNAYLSALAQRAFDGLGDAGQDVSATRGHLVRQAIRDGLLRELDELMNEEGEVDLFCDPGSEIPLEIDSRAVTLAELISALSSHGVGKLKKAEDGDQAQARVLPMARAA